MSKVVEASEHISDLFESYRKESSIPMFVEFTYQHCPTQKVIYKPIKVNPSFELITKLNFVIVVNEDVFDKLSSEQQKIIISECFSGVRVNDSDAVSYDAPDVNTRWSTLKKFGVEEVNNTHETITLIYKQMKDKAAEEKANSEPKKRGRPKR